MAERPITPPPELVQQWISERYGAVCVAPGEVTIHVATMAARWGADTELEAICHWLITGPYGFSIAANSDSLIRDLRAARRPKPPSLKELALRDLNALAKDLERNGMGFGTAMIRRALEQLTD